MTLVLPTGYTCIYNYIRQKLNIPTFGPCRGEKKKRTRYSHHHLFICPLITIIEDQMEEAKDLGMRSVCAVSDEPNIEDIKSGKFHLIFGSTENVLDKYSVDALKYSCCHLRNRLVAFVSLL